MGIKFDSRSFAATLRDLRAEMATPSSSVRGAILKRASEVDAKQNAETFSKERDPRTGRKWLSLEDENKHYAKWKRRNYPGRKMLVWTGRLRDSARHNSGEGRVVRWSGNKIQLGTSDPLAIKHQGGETYSPVKKVYLREKRPQFYGGKFVRRNGKRTKQRKKGRMWFTLWMDRLPARPFIGKNRDQSGRLRGVVASELFKGYRKVAAGSGVTLRLAGTAAAGRLVIKQ